MEKEKIEGFINEIEKVCRKNNLSIAHEDDWGAFIIHTFEEMGIDCLKVLLGDIENETVNVNEENKENDKNDM